MKLIGGYDTLYTKAIKTVVNEHTNALERPFGPAALEALNWVQQSRWRINQRVLAVVEDMIERGIAAAGLPAHDDIPVPPRLSDEAWAALDDEARKKHRSEVEEIHAANAAMRAKRTDVLRRVHLARSLAAHPTIWFPHATDFRGRIYPLPQDLTPQGDSLSRGLLEFAEPVPVGQRGFYWLCVAFANAMGHDKLPLDQRYEWTRSHMPEIARSAKDPIGNLGWWAGDDVDSPWEALALAFEIADITYRDVEESRVPVRLDATCSGIQHLAALMRDPASGRAVNLVNTGRREDIYADVSEAAKAIVSKDAASGNALAHLWLGKVERKTVKRAVMTTPYGVTRRGIAEQLVTDGFCDHVEGAMRYKAADYLRDVIVASLDSRIGEPRRAMAYFQQVAGVLADANLPLQWTTPAEVTVRQGYYESDLKRIKTLTGEAYYRIEDPNKGLQRRKQVLASAPNVIHSFDAAHLMRTALRCKREGIQDLAFVHDSFGTHAGNTDLLSRFLREEFVRIYQEDQLALWHESVRKHSGIEIPAPPARGDLDVAAVLESPFFFS